MIFLAVILGRGEELKTFPFSSKTSAPLSVIIGLLKSAASIKGLISLYPRPEETMK